MSAAITALLVSLLINFLINVFGGIIEFMLITQTLMYPKVEKIQRAFTFMPVVRDIIYLSSCLLHKKICWIRFKH